MALVAACGGGKATPLRVEVLEGVTAVPSVTLRDFQIVLDVLEAEERAWFTLTSEGAGHTFTNKSLGVDVSMPAGTTRTTGFDVPADALEQIQLVCRFHE